MIEHWQPLSMLWLSVSRSQARGRGGQVPGSDCVGHNPEPVPPPESRDLHPHAASEIGESAPRSRVITAARARAGVSLGGFRLWLLGWSSRHLALLADVQPGGLRCTWRSDIANLATGLGGTQTPSPSRLCPLCGHELQSPWDHQWYCNPRSGGCGAWIDEEDTVGE